MLTCGVYIEKAQSKVRVGAQPRLEWRYFLSWLPKFERPCAPPKYQPTRPSWVHFGSLSQKVYCLPSAQESATNSLHRNLQCRPRAPQDMQSACLAQAGRQILLSAAMPQPKGHLDDSADMGSGDEQKKGGGGVTTAVNCPTR